MKERTKNIILYLIAGIFLLTVAFIVYSYVKLESYSSLLWICYTAMFLIALGILFRKTNLILSQVFILFIPDLFWVIDFLFMWLTGNSPFGMTFYFFKGDRSLLQEVLSLQHFYTIPLALYAVYLIKSKKNTIAAMLISLAELIFFFILMMVLSLPNGINCLPVYQGCASVVFPKFIPFPIIWLTLEISFIVFSYFVITTLPFIKNRIKY